MLLITVNNKIIDNLTSNSNKMTKKSKFIYSNGIEITNQLLFNDWKPGFEYTKNIQIKNLNTRSVKINYKYIKIFS